jgi:hypothetical protein
VTSLSFKDHLSSQFSAQLGSSESRLHVTYNHPSQSIKCDVATDRASLVIKVLHHTAVHDGIRYALPSLLLADKIRTYSERRSRDDAKKDNDLTDIIFLIGSMVDASTTMPDDLKTLILTDDVLNNFWNALPDGEKATYKEFLGEIGVALGVCYLYLSLMLI